MEIIIKLSPLALFFIMFCLGLTVKLFDFINIFKSPKNLLIGLFSQSIILPLVGFLFALIAEVDEEIKIGIILITCVPSALTSNYLTRLIHGNVNLSIGLTATAALLSFISIPIILSQFLPLVAPESNILKNMNFKKISLNLFLISTVPVFLGMITEYLFSNIVKKLDNSFRKASLVIFFLIIFSAWFSEWDLVVEGYKNIGVILLLLVIIIFTYVNILVTVFKIGAPEKKAIITETFIQNAAMAIVIGAGVFGIGVGYLVFAGIYGIFQYKVFMVWYIWQRNSNNLFLK